MSDKQTSFSFEETVSSADLLGEVREVLELHKDEAAKEYGLALVSILQNDFDAALAHIQNAIAKKPGEPFLYRRLAEILILQDEHDEALPFLEKVFERTPKDATTARLLLAVYHRTGNFEKAKKLEEYLAAYSSYRSAVSS